MTAEPKRVALVVGVRPGKREEYLELHQNVWPGVEAKLTELKKSPRLRSRTA